MRVALALMLGVMFSASASAGNLPGSDAAPSSSNHSPSATGVSPGGDAAPTSSSPGPGTATGAAGGDGLADFGEPGRLDDAKRPQQVKPAAGGLGTTWFIPHRLRQLALKAYRAHRVPTKVMGARENYVLAAGNRPKLSRFGCVAARIERSRNHEGDSASLMRAPIVAAALRQARSSVSRSSSSQQARSNALRHSAPQQVRRRANRDHPKGLGRHTDKAGRAQE